MKPKLLFVTKLFGYSLGLFILWGPVSNAYILLLNQLVRGLNSLDNYISGTNALHMKEITEYLIPFISLILATPRIPGRKKALAIAAGPAVFLCADLMMVEYALSHRGLSSETSMIFSLLLNVKWLLPFLLWIITSYPYLEDIFGSRSEACSLTMYPCPLCGEEHDGILDHIRQVHGEKSLRIKKVRMFLSEHTTEGG